MPSVRTRRIAREVISALAGIVDQELRDPRVQGVTFTAVDMSPDLKHARVFYSTRGNEQQQRECSRGLVAASGYLRRELGRKLALRFTPDLAFTLDGSLERAERIQRLLSGADTGEAKR
ncbi:MAG TPA: 30S ribosome-binding factor RbfA [Deltaproteobacteria bacterium]|nr:30S ribosome-binding factor RbfA [Candidatus Binatota bacterium]HIL12701.1 30S ribosome-binding factor RbfA [Deltaproteobacteria bacterium]